ncbi:hypothetical protein OJJOAM_003685 [Cupriavidus sp. H18C1]
MASENRIVPVVLCGGTGSRLWPLSRDGHPKQFLRLLGDHTLLQDTLLRVRDIDGVGAPILVSNEAHRFVVAEQAREIGCEPAAILLEPHARNTAPAAAVAAIKAQAGGDDPILLVLPSDHLVRDHAAFASAVTAASAAAAAGAVATLGVVPTFPATGYGYIKAVPTNDGALMTVKRFVEKPSLEQATDFLGEGNCYWNSGMFLFRASVYLAALRQFAPDILRAAEQALARGKSDLDFCRLDADAFGACPSDSIDYAVMEHLRDGRMAPLAADWSDIGSWDAVWKAAEKTEGNNAAVGNVVTHRARDCLVHASHRMVAVAGLENVIVVETPDVVLVVHKDHAQDVKQLVETLRAQGTPRGDAASAGLPALGVVRQRRSWPALSGQTHQRQTRRQAVAAEASPPRRALGGGVGHRARAPRRRRIPADRGSVHLYPDRRDPQSRKSRPDPARADRDPVRLVPWRR